MFFREARYAKGLREVGEVGEKMEVRSRGVETGARARGRAKECGKRRIRATTRAQNTDV